MSNVHPHSVRKYLFNDKNFQPHYKSMHTKINIDKFKWKIQFSSGCRHFILIILLYLQLQWAYTYFNFSRLEFYTTRANSFKIANVLPILFSIQVCLMIHLVQVWSNPSYITFVIICKPLICLIKIINQVTADHLIWHDHTHNVLIITDLNEDKICASVIIANISVCGCRAEDILISRYAELTLSPRMLPATQL